MNHIPSGFHSVTPMICFKDSEKAMEFYKQAFGAEEIMRLTYAGSIVHAEITVEGSMIMLADENPQYNATPETLGGTTVILNIYVRDADSFAAKAVDAGAELIFPIQDQFYGARSGRIKDPFGYVWIISQHIEDVSAEEMQRRMEAM